MLTLSGATLHEGPRQVPRPEAHTWVRRDYEVSFPESGPPPPWMNYSLPLAALRRSAWEVHPFYEDAWGSEDQEWGHWALRQGWVVRYVADSVVMHSHNYTLRQLYGRRFIEGEADAFILGDKDGVLRMLRRGISSIGRDVIAHVKARDPVGLGLSPVRRAVYQWAYYRGHKLGEARRARGDRDASKGKKRPRQDSAISQGRRESRSHSRSFCRPRSRPIRKWLRSLAL